MKYCTKQPEHAEQEISWIYQLAMHTCIYINTTHISFIYEVVTEQPIFGSIRLPYASVDHHIRTIFLAVHRCKMQPCNHSNQYLPAKCANVRKTNLFRCLFRPVLVSSLFARTDFSYPLQCTLGRGDTIHFPQSSAALT